MPESFHYLVIEGPIGVGKTSLANKLAQEEQAFLVAEKAFHQALKAQQIDLGYKEGAGPKDSQSMGLPGSNPPAEVTGRFQFSRLPRHDNCLSPFCTFI